MGESALIKKIALALGILFCGIFTLTGFGMAAGGGDTADWILTAIFLALTIVLVRKWPKEKKPTGRKAKTSVKTSAKSKSHPTVSRAPDSSDELAYIDTMDGHAFEQFVADLLRKLGYEHVEVTPGSGDQGVDIIARKNGTRYAIQCKRYSKKLGNKPVQEAYAGKAIYGCSVAAVVTNNYFTEGAKEAARSTGVLLWDRDELKQMIRFSNWKNL